MELFEVKFSFLAEIGNVGGGRRAPETSQAVRLKGTPHFKIHRRYILRFDITEQPKLYLFYTLACGRIGLICPDSSPCWDNTCQSAPAMFVFSKIIVRNDCTESWQVGQTVFSEHLLTLYPRTLKFFPPPRLPNLPWHLLTASFICGSTLVSVLSPLLCLAS